MFASVTRRLAGAEKPLLDAAGLTMWEYIVLSRLAVGTAPSQLTLAREIHHDKTRLIRLLDDLQDRGLIERAPDPTDRRFHTVGITVEGRKTQVAAQKSIRRMEDDILGSLTATERRALMTALPKLRQDS
jgi:MarR family transcriptional regulator, organic hydroperoxide resistance regulator